MSKQVKPKRILQQADAVRSRQNAELMVALLPLYVMAVYLYGPRPLVMLAVAFFTDIVCEWLACLFLGRRCNLKENSGLLAAALLVCLMPASLPYGTVAVMTACAVFIGKYMLGGEGHYLFQPVAVGYVIGVVSWPTQMLTFPTPQIRLSLGELVGVATSEAPAYTLKLGGLPGTGRISMLLGNFAGPLGNTASLVILASALLLIVMRRFDFITAASYLAGVAGMILLFPRVASADRLQLLESELLCTGILYCAVFLLQDPEVAPKKVSGRIFYGLFVGIANVLFCRFGSYPYGAGFALVVGNAFASQMDSLGSDILGFWRTLGRKCAQLGREMGQKHGRNAVPADSAEKKEESEVGASC